jgi:uncharacterized membrane protein YphA (DoxX/SURF4 family)
MKKLEMIGRILFAVPFAIIGFSHLFMSTEFMKMLEHSFFPGSMYAVILSGIMLIIASISILANKYVKVACLWLAGMLFLIIVTIHVPNMLIAEHFNDAYVNLLKDTALLGASIMISIFLNEKK